MFYERFLALCQKHDVKPTIVVQDIGLSPANATYWKNGSMPSPKNLQKLADYFEVPVEYILGTNKTITVDTRESEDEQKTISDVEFEKSKVILKEHLEKIDTIPKRYRGEVMRAITEFVEHTLDHYKTMVPNESFIGP